ncbi:MAG: sulfotransferase domain-containing protein [Planctomycetota bacterium]|jgi:hypothetical protein
MLTVVGFPRSGTNFLHRMLAHYMDGPEKPIWKGMLAHPLVSKIHWKYQDGRPSTLVYIYRDPRDVALSGWEYVQHHFEEDDLFLAEFLEHHFSGHWDLWPQGWREHTRYWLDRGIATMRYEDLCASREAALRDLMAKLHGFVDEGCLTHAVVQSWCFGERHDGRWKKELPEEAAEWIDSYCGDLMRELGYV